MQIGLGMIIGVVIGALFGMVMGSVAIFIAIGAGIGVAIGFIGSRFGKGPEPRLFADFSGQDGGPDGRGGA